MKRYRVKLRSGDLAVVVVVEAADRWEAEEIAERRARGVRVVSVEEEGGESDDSRD